MLKWNIYEITSANYVLHGVKFRGRIRVYGIDNNIDLLTENATDKDNCVRFAITDNTYLDGIKEMVNATVKGADVVEAMSDVVNPVLSRLKVNLHERYRGEL
ncbi:MAG: hypothetical protein ACI9T8_000596 [Candidatus Saccharimonadales bacterium]|jgi:hypothetical protein